MKKSVIECFFASIYIDWASITLSKFKILVVDDENDARLLIHRQLKSMGFEKIVLAKERRKALDEMFLTRFYLIIADWDMPGMDGLSFYKNIQANLKFQDIPFLLLTAQN